MDADMSTCIICGEKYKTCLSCKREMSIKPWRSIVDKISCYELFLTLSQYNNGYTSEEQARKQLEKIKYDKDSLIDPVRLDVEKILSNKGEKKNQKND